MTLEELSNIFLNNQSEDNSIALNAYNSKNYEESFEAYERLLRLNNLNEKESFLILRDQNLNIKHICDRFIFYNKGIVDKIMSRKSEKVPIVTFSMTTCKRFDLFEKTINSFLNCCCDIERIDKWICVDDNSSEKDRKKMQELYPFFNFILKRPDQKGHAKSMNIIRNLITTPYLLHMEDDFKFFVKREYIKDALDVLGHNNRLGQCLFNKNYSETQDDIIIKGGEFFQTERGFRYYIHEFADTPEKSHMWTKKHGKSLSSNYWPHFSFRPSLFRTEIFKELGEFDISAAHFEMDYARKYSNKGYVSAFFEGLYCIHIGRLTSEQNDSTKLNAYNLNNESQFFEKKEQKSSFIKVINLERRKDRKDQVISKLRNARFDESEYEFIKAIDGKELTSESENVYLFEGNDFKSRKGFIGCALSHFNLWKKLIEDKSNDFYLIMEDDFTLCNNFKEKMKCMEFVMKEKEVVFLGYHMFNKNREKFKEIYDIENNNITITKLDKNLYIGGYYCYSISKNGAIKMINYINNNGIKHGIDYLNKIMDVDSYEVRPQLSFSIWNEDGKEIDTDIQNAYDTIEILPLKKLSSNFVFIKGKDQNGNDLYFKKKSLYESMKIALKDENCVGFNTLGFFKNKIENLTGSNYFRENDGIYIKKNFRIKMICNWCSSEQLCKEWSNMCEVDYRWKNIEITSEDENIDYYVIINKPNDENIFYNPEKTLIFQMEPWVYDKTKNWGVKTWGKWSTPDENTFLYVGSHNKYLNNVQWQIEIPKIFPEKREDKLICILSNKNFDNGHIKRIEFIKFLELKGKKIVDVYGRKNYHNFNNYKGELVDDKKENHFVKYKYCLSVENNIELNYATEKIWEAILCESLCFYWGCPNIEEYINEKCYVRLNLDNFEKSLETIKKAIEEDWWYQRIDIIRKEKQKILNELGFFPRLKKLILI